MHQNIQKLKNYFKNISYSLNLKKIEEKPLVIIIPSYNNALWYKKNLDSVFHQKYDNYRVIYIDDASNDNTSNLVKSYVIQNKQQHRFKLIQNIARLGATANRYYGSHLCEDNEIILILDGDDWFANNQVLNFINQVYTYEDVWLTYGQFKRWPSNVIGQCKYLPQNFNFRTMDKWYTSALRTYYAWLFKKIKKEDLMDKNHFYTVAGDVAEMLPMLEMARGHIRFISKVLYIYNVQTNLNDFKINHIQQLENTKKIMEKKTYEKLFFK